MLNALHTLFLLDESLHFLNHGSFGACPRPVFEAYQAWQRRLERQPVLFLGREMADLDQEARRVLGTYLHTAADNLVFIPKGAGFLYAGPQVQPLVEPLVVSWGYHESRRTRAVPGSWMPSAGPVRTIRLPIFPSRLPSSSCRTSIGSRCARNVTRSCTLPSGASVSWCKWSLYIHWTLTFITKWGLPRYQSTRISTF